METQGFKPVWPGWETVRLIGRGSLGAVYEIERDMLGEKEKAALKVITIPENNSEIETLRDEGYDVFLEIEIKGFLQIREACPDCVSIFIIPPSFEELKLRLQGRGTEDAEVIAERLKTAEHELSHQHLFDYVVVNDDVDRAANEVLSILKNEKKLRAEHA